MKNETWENLDKWDKMLANFWLTEEQKAERSELWKKHNRRTLISIILISLSMLAIIIVWAKFLAQ